MPFSIERNDLASVSADVIIVAANEDLQITGGVGKAVAQVAGFEKVQEACNAIGHCPTGSAVVTPAFDLPAQAIIHAVGPVWQGGTHNEVRFAAPTTLPFLLLQKIMPPLSPCHYCLQEYTDFL